MPSRLSVSAADCLLSITGAVAKRDNTLFNKPKPSTITGSHQPVALIPNISGKKKKQSSLPEDSNSEANCILWNHLEELTLLVQCLFAVCSLIYQNVLDLCSKFRSDEVIP